MNNIQPLQIAPRLPTFQILNELLTNIQTYQNNNLTTQNDLK